MIGRLACTCEAEGCTRSLGGDKLMLRMETPGGVRHAYECSCGAVTITVARE